MTMTARCTATLVLGLASTALAAEPVFREQVTTPHWQWVDHHDGGTVRALFLVNYLAMREPDELAERFDLTATVVPATGDAYRNRWDDEALKLGLLERPDVIVIAATQPWRDLSDAAKTALHGAVGAGTSMVVFGGRGALPPWPDLLGKDASDLTALAGATIPIHAVPFRRTFRVTDRTAGRGHVMLVEGFDLHWTFFSAFQPSRSPGFDDAVGPELAYALCARLIRMAAGKQALRGERVAKLSPDFILTAPPSPGTTLRWAVHTSFGECVGHGVSTAPANITPLHGKATVCRWWLAKQDKTVDFGAFALKVETPVRFDKLEVPDVIQATDAVQVAWKTVGQVKPEDRVVVQVYDPDGRLMSAGTSPASKGSVSLGAWQPRSATHQCRLLYLRGTTVCDEARRAIHVRLDRRRDPQRFHVIVWATEGGAWVERNRYPLLRRLGVTAIAPIGKGGTAAARWMSQCGLRLVPTNILVPPNRYTNMKTYSQAKDEQKLDVYAAQVARYGPLGYSLADEPNTKGWSKWSGLGATIIRRHDPAARVGFCGVWLKPDKDVPGFFAACDFGEFYSPHHLYTPNLWLGVERDLYRSFLRDDGIYTCWTHYAPGADHEPYSRTVPWLWLFEGLNGVSYFDSAGGFAILPPNLRTTHETRWWSHEVRRLHEGIAEQIIALDRDAGSVRIVCEPGTRGGDVWARALNQSHVPYRFTTLADLADDANAKLVVCPSIPLLPTERLKPLHAVARRGGVVVVVGPLASGTTAQAKAVQEDVAVHQGVPAEIAWDDAGDSVLRPGALTGTTSGAHGIEPDGATVLARFKHLGEASADDGKARPEFIKRLFATPAALVRKHGNGTVVTLAFHPDIPSAGKLLGVLARQANLAPPGETIAVKGHPADTVYLYPFSGSRMRLLGVVQDYWRVAPTHENNVKSSACYFHHGPKRWASSPATLGSAKTTHVYDVRAGKYLGQRKSVPFTLQPGRPELFALLPYRVEKLTIEAPANVHQGQTLKLELTVHTDSGAPDRHVVHVRFVAPDGTVGLADRYNVHTKDGRGVCRHTVPLNATVGAWTVKATDAPTGVTTTHRLVVVKAPRDPGPTLTHRIPVVTRKKLDWPEGRWTTVQAKQEDAAPKIEVKVRPIQRRRQWHIRNHKGHLTLMGSFTMANPLITYGVQYCAVNDWKANKWADRRRIAAPYPPGLGFGKPRPHMWYYNGYMQVFFDKVDASAFALTKMEQVQQADGSGRVDVAWDTPYGPIELAFVLLPDHRGMFQQLVARPTCPVRNVTVRFRSYPMGFGKGGRLLKRVDEHENAWVLLGDVDGDRAYGKGMGPGAMLILPDQWQKVTYHPHRTSLTALVDPQAKPLDADAPPTKVKSPREIRLHWVLWMFPETSNDKALEYMRTHKVQTQRLLRKQFGTDNPGD